MTMLETLARAVEQCRWENTRAVVLGEKPGRPPTSETLVRAVLLALRSPDEGMLKVLASETFVAEHIARVAWECAIDHILTSEAGGTGHE